MTNGEMITDGMRKKRLDHTRERAHDAAADSGRVEVVERFGEQAIVMPHASAATGTR